MNTPSDLNTKTQSDFVPMTKEAIEAAVKKAGRMIVTLQERKIIEFAQYQPAIPSPTR